MVIKRGSFISMVFSSYLGKVLFQETLAFIYIYIYIYIYIFSIRGLISFFGGNK
jgi:hypothetical protein